MKIKKYFVSNFVSICILMSILFIVAGCGDTEKPQVKDLTIATASMGGVFYPVGVGIADLISKETEGLRATAEATGGSNENMNLINSDQVDLAFAGDDTGLPAFLGQEPFKEKNKMKFGWRLYEEGTTIVTLKSSGIKSVYDLKGKKINIGEAGSSSNTEVPKLLELHGIGQGEFKPAYLGWEKGADAIVDGLVDATIAEGPYPQPSIETIAARKEVNIVNVDPDVIEKNYNAPIRVGTIPSNTYNGQAEEGKVLAMPASVWIRDDLSEDVVYQVVKAVFENKDYLKSVHKATDGFTLITENEANEMGIEVHPGVIRYAKEIGAW